MFLVVGLGNPGSEYEQTRHNAGFMAAERFRHTHGLGRMRRRYHGRWCEGLVDGRQTAVLLPLTFMNNSGEAVATAAGRKHIPAEEIIVIHDDMDFPFGTIRVRAGGGSGGHRGLESIASMLGSDAFNRVRVGIGRPVDPFIDSRDWVLSPMDVTDEALLDVLERAVECIGTVITHGIEAAMNRFNRKDRDE